MEKKNQTYTWELILDIFIRDIEKQKYGKDQKIPTENETAVKYGVNRSEIRMVYKKLKEMGYIYSIRGCGSFCYGKRIKIPLAMVGGASFSSKMKELGLNYHTENIDPKIIRYQPDIYQMLQADPEDTIWKISLLRVVNGEPVALHIRYLNQKQFSNLPTDAKTIRSSREYLAQNGYANLKGRDIQLASTTISKKKRALLNMKYKQEALVLTGCTTSLDDGSVIEAFTTVYRSDCFLFTFS